MGNSQSQVTDDECVPQYNYHESVLRDAETASINSHPTNTNDVNNDEEYYSADETGSDENSADNSQDHEDNIVEDSARSESQEQHNLSLQPVAEVSGIGSNQADLNTVRSVNDNSASTLNQNDNHHCEPGNRQGRSSSWLRDADSIHTPDIDPSFNNRKIPTVQSGEGLMANVSNSHQFTPIPASYDLQGAAAGSHESAPCLGKRKMLRDSPQESILPRKKILTRNSSKRKWLGCSDTSESGVSETEEEVVRKSNKKRRLIVQSPKKSRRQDRDSRRSDSDERRYGKQKYTQKSRCCCDCKIAETDDERGHHNCVRKCKSHRNNKSDSSKKRRKYSNDESSDVSDDTSRYGKRHKCKRREANETDSEDERDNVETRRRYRNVRKNNDKYTNVDTACSQGCQTQVSMSMLGDGENMAATNTLSGGIVDASVDTHISSEPCHTFKMGNLSLRNSLGKVFPLKPPQQTDTSGPATLNIWRNMAAFSDIKNSPVVPNPRHSVDTNSSPVKMNKGLRTEKEPLSNVFVRSYSDTEGLCLQTDSNNQLTAATNLNESPFKNVVLTPSAPSDTSLTSLSQQPTTHTSLTADIGDDNISDMEVEQSDVTAYKSTQFVHSRLVNTSSVQSSHQKKTAAVRFRNFWLEKKKNIRQNLKSLFARTNPAFEKLPASMSPMWQTFSATSQAHSAWDNSLGRAVESSNSFLNRPATSSFVSQITPRQLQSDLLSTSFTTQSVQSHVTPQLMDVTSATKMSPEVFGSAGSKLQQFSSVADGLVEWLPPTGQYQVLYCRLAGAVDVSISTGELADQTTAGIVNWTDGALTHTVTSCSRSISAKAGPLMQAACNDYIGTQGSNLAASDVLTTPAGGRFDSAVQAILHVVEPTRCAGNEEDNSHALMEVFANCLRFARSQLGLDSISCPLIGDGIFPFVTCVQSFLDAVLVFLTEQPASGDPFHVHLVIPDRTAVKMAANFVRSYLECVSRGHSHGQPGSGFTQYVGHKPHMKHLDAIRKTNLAPSFTVERTDSGRPRLKRPRL